MNLPIYQIIYLKSGQIEELNNYLHDEINFRCPVAFEMSHLDEDQQRESIGLIDNFFATRNISYKFPYPIFIVSVFNQSYTRMPMVKSQNELPRLFKQKDGRLSIKDSTILAKNKLYQQEVKNIDPLNLQETITHFANSHRKMHLLDYEKKFYKNILDYLNK